MLEIGRLSDRKGTLMPSRPVLCLLSGHALNDRALVSPELLLMPSLDSADYAKILNVGSKSMIPHQNEGRPPPQGVHPPPALTAFQEKGGAVRGSANHPLQGATAWCLGQVQSYSESGTNVVGLLLSLSSGPLGRAEMMLGVFLPYMRSSGLRQKS